MLKIFWIFPKCCLLYDSHSVFGLCLIQCVYAYLIIGNIDYWMNGLLFPKSECSGMWNHSTFWFLKINWNYVWCCICLITMCFLYFNVVLQWSSSRTSRCWRSNGHQHSIARSIEEGPHCQWFGSWHPSSMQSSRHVSIAQRIIACIKSTTNTIPFNSIVVVKLS